MLDAIVLRQARSIQLGPNEVSNSWFLKLWFVTESVNVAARDNAEAELEKSQGELEQLEAKMKELKKVDRAAAACLHLSLWAHLYLYTDTTALLT